MLSIGVVDGLDIIDLPVLKGDMAVVCLFQDAWRLNDPIVRARDFVIMDLTTNNSKQWIGIHITKFIKGIRDELSWQAVKC